MDPTPPTGPTNVWDALIAEGSASGTHWVAAVILVAIVVSRLLPAARHQRLPGTLWLYAVHLVLLVTTAVLSVGTGDGAHEARIASRVLVAMSFVGALGALVFGTLLSHVRAFRVSRILQDLIVAGATFAVVAGVLHNLGVSLSGLLATSAVLTAVIGLALQDTLGNTVGGLALQADGSVRVGDWVKVGDVAGLVAEIRWRYTAVETRNWETVLVPNSVMMKGPVAVLGRRHGKPEQWRRWVKFNVDFRFAPNDVIDTVQKALRQPIERVSVDPPPDCILLELTESYAIYAVRYWLTDLAHDDGTDSGVRTRIVAALRRAEIPLSIPAHAVFMTEMSKKRREMKYERERTRRIEALRQAEVFKPLDDAEIAELADALHEAPFAANEVITRQGSEGHWLYLLVDGTVAVRLSQDGEEKEIARMTAPACFGEMSLLTGAPRAATVVAVNAVECYRLERLSFQELLKRRPEVAQPIAELLAARSADLARSSEALSDEARERRRLMGHDLFQRMKSWLLSD